VKFYYLQIFLVFDSELFASLFQFYGHLLGLVSKFQPLRFCGVSAEIKTLHISPQLLIKQQSEVSASVMYNLHMVRNKAPDACWCGNREHHNEELKKKKDFHELCFL
jgi:hypothetical protein